MLEILQAVSDILYLMILHVKQAKKIVSMTNWKNGWHSEALPLVERTVVLEKTLESPLDCKEIQPVHPKGNQS